MVAKIENPALDRKTARLLDANLNRAREGLRVVEDAARFILNDKSLYRRVRALRHRLEVATRSRYRDLLESRESRSAVGRRVPEGGRSSLADVVRANMRRIQEAVRVLEEFSKVFSSQAARLLKDVRYRLYDMEKDFSKKFDT